MQIFLILGLVLHVHPLCKPFHVTDFCAYPFFYSSCSFLNMMSVAVIVWPYRYHLSKCICNFLYLLIDIDELVGTFPCWMAMSSTSSVGVIIKHCSSSIFLHITNLFEEALKQKLGFQ